MTDENKITSAYNYAKERYAELGVDVDKAIKTALKTPISLHCWQGDDVLGFEGSTSLSGGIQATGNYLGRARNIDELRMDMEKMLSFIPGKSKINLHANYLDSDKSVDRNEIDTSHFASWAQWAKTQNVGLDFNSTFFSHKLAENGTLTNPDSSIRNFWIEHAKRVRKISEFFGEQLGQTCITNHWLPDGEKEVPITAYEQRLRLKESFDEIFKIKSPKNLNKDAVESKLFGIGSEGYVAGSHEFYLAYAVKNPEILLTLDAGHFHPTEVISSKIPSLLCFVSELLLHVSRPMRWDSDHVVLLDDETKQIMREIIHSDALERVNIATDYFDASINRISAWTVGARNTRKALLLALLEPADALKKAEIAGDKTTRMALNEEAKTLPFGAVWDYLCLQENVSGMSFIQEIKTYEKTVLVNRK